jgi:hypothetical protein
MEPQELAARLRHIASKIEHSERPSSQAVVRELRAAWRAIATGADNRLVEFILDYESKEPLMHEVAMAFNAADERFLKDEGYGSEEALGADDSEPAKDIKRVYELMRKQTELISNTLRSIQPELAAIDREIHGAV